jgi:hypothetical protein
LQGSVSTLQTGLTSVQTSFGKLDANTTLTAQDVAGTYAVRGIQFYQLTQPGFTPGVGNAQFAATATMDALGNFSLNSSSCTASELTLAGVLSPPGICQTSQFGTWSFSSNGTITALIPGSNPTVFNVSLGGRLLTTTTSAYDGLSQANILFMVMSRTSQP